MAFFSSLARIVWKNRSEIVFAVQALSSLRKTAKEWTQEYIRQRIQKNLRRRVVSVGIEILCLVGAYLIDSRYHSLGSRLLASTVLWVITLYNLTHLCLWTIPELREVYRRLKGKPGFALKYLLSISLITELMELNVIFLIVLLAMGISSRGVVGSHFSYFKPWRDLRMIAVPVYPRARSY